MLQKRISTQSHHQGLQLSSPEDGCCPGEERTGCLYRFQFATTPTSFESITVDGVVVPFVHTYSDKAALYQALYDLFTKSVNEDGLGVLVHANDIKVYMDSFIGAAGNSDLTIEIISAFPITSITTNLGAQATATAVCDQINMCLHAFNFVNTENLKLVINNVVVANTTYATGALLRTGLATALGTAGMTDDAVALVSIPAVGTTNRVRLYVREGWNVYVNDVKISRTNCESKFLAQ
jgi:hypothetical protein